MTDFHVAHLREQGQDIIMVVVSSSFGHRSTQEQIELQADLQRCATAAGLAGTVVPVWEVGGRLHSLAPHEWRSYFQSLNWEYVRQNVNRRLSCG
jgi:hypothetical protein